MRVKFLCRTAPQKAEAEQSYIKSILRLCGGVTTRICSSEEEPLHACAAIVKDLVTVSSLAASFTAVANCAIGNLSYLAICNGQMAGNWAPYPERRLLKGRRSREQSALNDWPSSRIIVQ